MLNARIVQKHDTQANWDKAINFIPKNGKIIVYDADDNYPYARTKIGDGVTTVGNLPFAVPEILNTNIVNGEAVGSLRTISSATEDDTYKIGTHAFTEGYDTKATVYAAHAEGESTIASGRSAHAEGYFTIASASKQHVQGQFNATGDNYAHIVGNGTSTEERSNAHTLDWNGLGWFAGGLKIGGTGQDDAAAVSVLTENDLAIITESEIDAICGVTISYQNEVSV